MDSLHELANAIKEAVARMQALQPQFENYIKNKEILLELRWSLWENAPTEMKRQQGWCSDLEFEAFRIIGIKPNDAIGYDGQIYHADRYRTVKTEDIVDALAEHCDWHKVDEETTEKVISALKEEILEDNIYSAVYDW